MYYQSHIGYREVDVLLQADLPVAILVELFQVPVYQLLRQLDVQSRKCAHEQILELLPVQQTVVVLVKLLEVGVR